MKSLILLMGAVCLAPVLVSLGFSLFAAEARPHRLLVGALGALSGFLLGLIAVFCGVMIPLSSIGLSGQAGKHVDSLAGSVGYSAAGAALIAAALSGWVTRLMSRAIGKKREAVLP